MKLAKAIGILTLDKDCSTTEDTDDWIAAVKLGIEALKQIQYLREIHILLEAELLPGETISGT